MSSAAELKAQRLVSANRLALALAALATAELAPVTIDAPGSGPLALLVAYFAYALLTAVLLGLAQRPMSTGRVLTQLIDAVAIGVLLLLTHGPSSPFFLFVPFLLFTAGLQGSSRSYAWLTVLTLGLFVGMWVYAGWYAGLPLSEQHHVIMRGVFLFLIALWIARWRAYEIARARDLARLTDWPAKLAAQEDFLSAIDTTLEHAAALVLAERVLLFWQGSGETRLHLADRGTKRTRLAEFFLPTVHSLVAEPLADRDFLCARVRAERSAVLIGGDERYERWQGSPVDERFRQRFDVRDLLSIHLQGEAFTARLMFLGLAEPTSDRLRLAQLAGRQVGTCLAWLAVQQSLLESERTRVLRRIADDLHDGLLQSLVGLNLSLERLHPALAGDLQGLRQLAEIQDALAEEQRLLRLLILDPSGTSSRTTADSFHLESQLHRMAAHIQGQYGAKPDIITESTWPPVGRALAREIYLLIHEAVLNSLRHGSADMVTVRLGLTSGGRLGIQIEDDGNGFDFRGRYSLDTLRGRGWAPQSLTRRIVRLDGDMVIESGPKGARIEATVPNIPPRSVPEVKALRSASFRRHLGARRDVH